MFFVMLLVLAVSAAEVRPKYLFLLIGDGMGPNVVKFYRDQMGATAFDKLGEAVPTGTNNFFGKTTDSAASGTALACGVKTYIGSMAMDKDKRPLTSLAKILKKRGMKVGLISSVAINDAPPGTHYCNRLTRKDNDGTFADLAASNFDFFGVASFKKPKDMHTKDMLDQLKKSGFTIQQGAKGLAALKPENKNIFFGNTRYGQKPSLADVTQRGIELLDNPNGFFMMVEGGAIDGGNHCNCINSMMGEMIEFDKMISVVLKFAEKHPQETLIVVTADHDTGGLMIDGKVPTGFWKKQLAGYGSIDRNIQKMRKAKAPKAEIIAYVCKNVGIDNLTADEQKRVNAAAERFMAGKRPKKRVCMAHIIRW